MTLQYHLPLPQRAAMAAEDFLVTPTNHEAALWLLERTPADWPSHALILYGPAGCGKTHLLTAWSARVGAQSLTAGDKEALNKLVQADATHPPVALDDADGIAGKASAEEWLQHLYNATKAAHIPLLLTAQTPPGAWGLHLKDIASRLNSCQTASVHEPDDDLLRALLVKQFNDRQLLVEDGVIEYLVRRLERTGAAVRTTVEKLDAQALAAHRKISVPLAQKLFDTQRPAD